MVYDPATDSYDGVSSVEMALGNAPAPELPPGPNLDHPKRVSVPNLRLLHDYLAVAPLSVSMRNAGGLMFIPEAAGVRERSQRGIVLAVGPGDWNDAGTALVPMTVRPGDLVFFGKYAGTEEELGGRLVLIMRENECRVSVPAGGFEVVEHENPKLNHLVEDWCDVCYGDPEADARARLEVARQAQADAQNAVCGCGHRGAEHAHLTGPCKQCDCMEFRPIVDEVADLPQGTLDALYGSAAAGGQTDKMAAEARGELTDRYLGIDYGTTPPFTVQGHTTDVQPAATRRPCVEPGCKLMQTRDGDEWRGRKCGHRHPADLV